MALSFWCGTGHEKHVLLGLVKSVGEEQFFGESCVRYTDLDHGHPRDPVWKTGTLPAGEEH